MKLFAPKYYLDFKCIADKCNHSCCIGWEIDIDASAIKKYYSLSNPYSKEIYKSISTSLQPHFNMTIDNKCPHLDERGLCKIILNCGEDYLCDICREHPRFYNYTNQGKEVGLGMSCEAACELILASDEYDQIVEIDDVDGDAFVCEFDAIECRNRIYKIIKNNALSVCDKIESLNKIYGVKVYDLPVSRILYDLEYINDKDKTLFCNIETLTIDNSFSTELTRILAYFVYRHCSEACDKEEFNASLFFSIFCVALISSLAKHISINEASRIVSEEIEYSEENTQQIKELYYDDHL